MFPVSAKKRLELEALMKRLGVSESDLEERFIRSSGPGGQRLNKVETCVVIIHRPTGLKVRCQRERSQALNRFFARRSLMELLKARRLGHLSEQARRVAKLRRQKRRRLRRTREKLLRLKRLRAKKKLLRGPVHVED